MTQKFPFVHPVIFEAIRDYTGLYSVDLIKKPEWRSFALDFVTEQDANVRLGIYYFQWSIADQVLKICGANMEACYYLWSEIATWRQPGTYVTK